jgi:hypothetical protein
MAIKYILDESIKDNILMSGVIQFDCGHNHINDQGTLEFDYLNEGSCDYYVAHAP